MKVKFPEVETIRVLLKAKQKLLEETQEMLEAVGVRLLSFIQSDYEAKSRGGMGAGGIVWKQLAPSTIKRKAKRGKRNAKRKTTKTGKARPGVSSQSIGIDTGLQRNSASPGYIAPDGKGGNVFKMQGVRLTVGFGREYSEYFDEKRTLIPDPLPQEWMDEMVAIVQDKGLLIVTKELS